MNTTLVCPSCKQEVDDPRATQVYCSEKCRKREEKKRYAARKRGERCHQPQFSITCAQCGEVFEVAHRRRKYCTAKCKNRARYLQRIESGAEDRRNARKAERYRNDPETRARKFMKAHGISRDDVPPLDVPKLKSCPSCWNTFLGHRVKEYCSTRCRRREANARYLAKARIEGRTPWVIIPSAIHTPGGQTLLWGVSAKKVRLTGGYIAYCPTCYDRCVLYAFGEDYRECVICGTRAELRLDQVMLPAA